MSRLDDFCPRGCLWLSVSKEAASFLQSIGVFTTFPPHFRFTSGGHISFWHEHDGCGAHNYVVDQSDGQIGILLAVLELFQPTSGSLPVEMRGTGCHNVRLVNTSRMAVFPAQMDHLSPSYTSIPVNFRSFLANGLRWHAPDLRIESHGLENPFGPLRPRIYAKSRVDQLRTNYFRRN